MNTRAYAKLNLTLDVLGKRDDGYHELDMIMQEISLFDTLSVETRPAVGKGSVFLRLSRVRNLPTDDHNLCVKAAKAFLDAYGITDTDVDMVLEKHLPVGAGLGGGSSDAAAVLRLLNEQTGVRASAEELGALAAKIGSDVPFFITGGTCRCTGTGTTLSPVAFDRREMYVVAKPSDASLTPGVYAAYDALGKVEPPATEAFLTALSANKNPYDHLCNHLTPAVLSSVPAVGELLDVFSSLAMPASVTGSGSAVFGVAKSYFEARKAVSRLTRSGVASFVKMALPVTR